MQLPQIEWDKGTFRCMTPWSFTDHDLSVRYGEN